MASWLVKVMTGTKMFSDTIVALEACFNVPTVYISVHTTLNNLLCLLCFIQPRVQVPPVGGF